MFTKWRVELGRRCKLFLTSTVFLRNALIFNDSHFGLGTTSGARG